MNTYQYNLQRYSGPGSRYDCPECRKRKRFTRYVDRETGETLHPSVGLCDRKGSCGYHLSPSEYLRRNGISFSSAPAPRAMQHKPKSPSYIKHSLVKASRKAFQRNHFFIFLTNIFGADVAKELADLYLIGTSKYWPGATVFWQVDCENRVRTGKVMLYDLQTGKRVKEPCSRIHWAHCLVNDPHFRLSQCLFGEHLLREYPGKPVVIVESEKSALIASAYYHEYVWLASGGISQLNMEKCLSLKGRNITLIPDADAFLAWQEKARILEKDLEQRVKVSRALEDIATETERGEGWDIADFLLKKKLKGLLNI